MKDIKLHPKIISSLTRAITFICGILLIVVLFVPLWKITLDAPQYPEGLVMKMYPNRLSGDVEIINGLNHYIGMKTLHTDDFKEFAILPYLISFFALFCIVTAIFRKKIMFTVLTISFAIFGIVSMVDFWQWEYDYGHNLDPNAAIQIPGMSYQPPLLGFKQLLNFGAFSVPDIGGIIFFGTGIILLVLFIYELRRTKKMKTGAHIALAIALAFCSSVFMACSDGPQPIHFGSDACAHCRMPISDKQYGAELLTKKGKAYKFDDLHCLFAFMGKKEIEESQVKNIYFVNYLEPHQFIEADKTHYLKSEKLRSPMGSNTASFANIADLEKVKASQGGTEMKWLELKNE